MSYPMCDDCKYVKYSFDGSTECGYHGEKDCNFIPREKKGSVKDKDVDKTDKQIFENERLNIELQSMRSAANSYKMHYEKAQIEIDRLQKNIDGLNIFTKNYIKVIRLQAMKEFAERLKEKLQWDVEFDNKLVFESDIDNLVKEMVGDTE